jgi:DNA-binding GntR family transcriptional regulator
MEPLKQFDVTQAGRPMLTRAEREARRQSARHQARHDGYEQLTELCRIGEVDMAARLAERHSDWGYEIVDGTVMERLPPDKTRVL